MSSLKNMLLIEQYRLENILRKVRDQLKDAPSGSLRLSKSKKWTQYYHCIPGDRNNGIYIPKSNGELIYKLAQEAYDEKILKLTERRLAQIKKITKDYNDDEIEKVYWNEHPERQKLIKAVEPTWEQQVEHWMREKYEGKPFMEDTPVIMTERGERVRSKSEKIMADYFYRKNIPYKYECPLYLKNYGIVYPDFTFLSKKTRSEIYWEHDGMMDDPTYAKNAVKKINAYYNNDIYPGEKLILTFETKQTILDTQIIERMIDKYL